MAERQIVGDWRFAQGCWRIVNEREVSLWPDGDELVVETINETTGIPFVVLAEVLRLSGYDVSKREEGT